MSAPEMGGIAHFFKDLQHVTMMLQQCFSLYQVPRLRQRGRTDEKEIHVEADNSA